MTRVHAESARFWFCHSERNSGSEESVFRTFQVPVWPTAPSHLTPCRAPPQEVPLFSNLGERAMSGGLLVNAHEIRDPTQTTLLLLERPAGPSSHPARD